METTFVLLRSNFSDQSDWMPVNVSKNQNWLISVIPDEFERVNDGSTACKVIPTFLNKKTNEYFEIRTVEEITKEPYKTIDLKTLTKKRFAELTHVETYGSGKNRILKLFIDHRQDFKVNAVGWKYCVTGYGCTKANLIKNAYDMLVDCINPDENWKEDGENLVYYETRIAETEQERFKIPISAKW